MSKVFFIVVGCVLLVMAGGFVYFLIVAAIAETYSEAQTGYAIDEAKKERIFISQPALENNVIELEGFKYPIRELWIEQSTRVEYKWIFIRKRIPTGYRLMLTLTVPNESPECKHLLADALRRFPICNDTIWLTTIVPSARKDIWLFYGVVTEPFTQSARLKFKEYR